MVAHQALRQAVRRRAPASQRHRRPLCGHHRHAAPSRRTRRSPHRGARWARPLVDGARPGTGSRGARTVLDVPVVRPVATPWRRRAVPRNRAVGRTGAACSRLRRPAKPPRRSADRRGADARIGRARLPVVLDVRRRRYKLHGAFPIADERLAITGRRVCELRAIGRFLEYASASIASDRCPATSPLYRTIRGCHTLNVAALNTSVSATQPARDRAQEHCREKASSFL